MKLVVPTDGNDLDALISKSFGRAKNFLIIDLSSSEVSIIENLQNVQSAQGAGIQSAQNAVTSGGDAIITINCGPKAYRVLSESGVKVYKGIDGSVQKNIEEFKKNKLNIMNNANVESHWI